MSAGRALLAGLALFCLDPAAAAAQSAARQRVGASAGDSELSAQLAWELLPPTGGRVSIELGWRSAAGWRCDFAWPVDFRLAAGKAAPAAPSLGLAFQSPAGERRWRLGAGLVPPRAGAAGRATAAAAWIVLRDPVLLSAGVAAGTAWTADPGGRPLRRPLELAVPLGFAEVLNDAVSWSIGATPAVVWPQPARGAAAQYFRLGLSFRASWTTPRFVASIGMASDESGSWRLAGEAGGRWTWR